MSISSIDELLIFFIIYSFIGYIWEVLCVLILQRKLVNRGFLYGPCIPLYGISAIVILYFTSSITNPVILFIVGMISASLLELLTGILMLKIFKVRYWDYSVEFLNFKGYICLKASIVWGIFSVFLSKTLHPVLYSFLTKLNVFNNHVMLYIFIFVFTVDVTLSIKNAYDFKTLLEKLKEDNNNNRIPDILETIPEHARERINEAKIRLIKLKEKHPSAVFDEKLQEIIRKIHNI